MPSVHFPIEMRFLGSPANLHAALRDANEALRDMGFVEFQPSQDGDEIWLVIDPVAVTGWSDDVDRLAVSVAALERAIAVLAGHPFEPLAHDKPHTAGLPLFVAVNAGCNLRCWYCTEHGENRAFQQPQLTVSRLLELLTIAYEAGYRTFRFTGGEPTNRPEIGKLMRSAQELGDDVRIAITTNGAHMERVLPVLEHLVEPKVFLSVDGLAIGRAREHPRRRFEIEKWLTEALMVNVELARQHAAVRFNFVLTASSEVELWPLLDFARFEGIDVKIFELLIRDFFFAHDLPRRDVFEAQYVPIRKILPELLSLGEAKPFPGLGGRGIPMRYVDTGSNRIIYFDSLAGSHYSPAICGTCVHHPCQEGLYAPVLNASGTLHPAGCMNSALHVPIVDAHELDAEDAFHLLRREIHKARLETRVPDELERHLLAYDAP